MNNNLNDDEIKEAIRVKSSPVELLLKNPDWIFLKRSPNPADLIAALSKQIIALGCQHLKIVYTKSWFIVSSQTDWMRLETHVPPNDQFTLMIPCEKIGVNQIRSEIAVFAFAKDVVVVENGVATQVKGDTTPTVDLSTKKRAICFRLFDNSR